MSDVYTVTKAKAKLSSIINEVEHKHKKVFISKKGKNIAVIVPLEEYIKQFGNQLSKKGLILAKNALADIEDIDSFIDDIYQARRQTFERKIHL